MFYSMKFTEFYIPNIANWSPWSTHLLSKRKVVGSNPSEGVSFLMTSSRGFDSPNPNGYLALSFGEVKGACIVLIAICYLCTVQTYTDLNALLRV